MAQRVTILPSKARTSDTTSDVITISDKYAGAAHIVVDITAGSPNLVVAILGKDETSGKSYTILTSSIINTGTTVMRIDPLLTAAANVAKDRLPYDFYATVTQSGGVSATYSIGASIF